MRVWQYRAMEEKTNKAFVCIISVELFIPMAHSLKEKRKQVKGLKERLMSRFNASVSEIAYLDEWQRSVLGISMISNDKRYLEKQFSSIKKMILEARQVEIINTEIEWV